MSITVISKKDVKDKIISSLEEIALLSEPLPSIARQPDGSFITTKNPASLIKSLEFQDSGFLQFLLESINKTETIGPGSSKLLSKYCLSLLETKLTNYDNHLEKALNELYSKVKPITEKRITENYLSTAGSFIAFEAIKLAGYECKIHIEQSPSFETTIERMEGFNFRLKPDENFLNTGIWKKENVRCFIVDGIIESVSEIDSLLHDIHDKNESLIIFARGFKSEPLSTMHVNHLRGTLSVMPVRVQYDMKTVNVLNDLALVLGGDVISSLKGELISTVKRKDLAVAKSIICKGNTVTIKSNPNKNNVATHLRSLLRKKDNIIYEDMKNFYDERIRSLSSGRIVVRLGTSAISELNVKINDIDTSIRNINSLLKFGEVTPFKTKNPLLIHLFSLTEKSISTLTAVSLLRYGVGLTKVINSIGAGIIED